jgi:hypothetical protein
VNQQAELARVAFPPRYVVPPPKPREIKAPLPTYEDAVSHLEGVQAKHGELQRAVDTARSDVEKTEKRIATAGAREARERDKLKDRAAQSYIDGVEFDPAASVARIRDAEAERLAAEGVLPHAKAKLAEAERALSEYELDFGNAVLSVAAVLEAEIVARIRDGLAAVSVELGELAGVSRWRAGLIGERFTFDPERFTPICGHAIAKVIVEAVSPLRVAPDGLSMASIKRHAAEAAARIEQNTQQRELV